MAIVTIDQQWIMLALLLELMLLLMIHSLTYLIRQKVTLENGGGGGLIYKCHGKHHYRPAMDNACIATATDAQCVCSLT